MTDKEKARAYDDALEIAKNEINIKGIGETVELCERLFPELRESEDERIRKWLVDYFGSIKEAAWIHRDITCEQILGWLERQKEPHYTKRNALFDKCVENCDPKVMEEVSDKVDEMLGKEQKPAEWSEEDKRKLNRIYEILGYAADDKGFLTSKRIIGDKEAIELQDFLKSLRPSWKPSEEQMGTLERWLLDNKFKGDSRYVYPIFESLYNDLKKLI